MLDLTTVTIVTTIITAITILTLYDVTTILAIESIENHVMKVNSVSWRIIGAHGEMTVKQTVDFPFRKRI